MAQDFDFEAAAARHAEAIKQEMEQWESKTEAERVEAIKQNELEALGREIGALSAELDTLSKFPSMHKARITELREALNAKHERSEYLLGKANRQSWQTAGNHVFQIYPGGDVSK